METIERPTLQEFEIEIDKLMKWFKKNLSSGQVFQLYEAINKFPSEAVKSTIENIIENTKPLPGNFPTTKEILHQCYLWLDDHPDAKFHQQKYKYDIYEDLKYPIEKLYEGYNIIQSYGEQKFYKFAEKNRMPQTDRERVVFKYKYVNANRSPDKKIEEMTNNIGKNI